ncbi:MAG TPA: hypothetical protein VNC21_13920 [Vicinamibacterales bacterium]|nr:hypothetical protein [Vicinamibacterales bacterium]
MIVIRLLQIFAALVVFVISPIAGAVPARAVQAPKSAPAAQKPKPKPPSKKPDSAKAAAKEAPPKPAGLTMRTTYTAADGQTSTTTMMSNGVRQRVELGRGVAVITQCDRKQIIQVNDTAKIFVAVPLDAAPVQPTPPAAPTAKKAGTVEYITTSTDTGERKEISGLSARHITTVVTKNASPDACDKKKERVQTDGWYATIPVQIACGLVSAPPPPAASDCHDEHRSSSVGEPPPGSPLNYTMTTVGEDGKEVASVKMAVTDLTLAPVDAALLDAPAGYSKATDAKSFLEAVERAANEERWGAPKAAGVIRVGVLMPANKTGQELSTDGVRAELLDALTTHPYEAVPIKATTAAEQEAEAKSRGCDYVLALDLTSLKASAPGKVGGLLRKASGGGSPTELYEAKAEYRLFVPGTPAPKAAKAATEKSGAFTLKRAIGLARFAARLYLTGPTSMLKMMNQTGAAGGGLPAQSMDPSMNAVNAVFNLIGGGKEEPVDEMSAEATLAAVLRHASSDVMKEISTKK